MNLTELRWLRLQCIDQDPRIDLDQVRSLVEQAINLIQLANETEEVEASDLAEDLIGVGETLKHNATGWKECLSDWKDLTDERDQARLDADNARLDLSKLRDDVMDFAQNVVGRAQEVSA
jgi:hypothetical protein